MSAGLHVVGRFAPSPTGPLHLGSLVAAVGSWLFARSAGGRWIVRMEDIDLPRVIPGAADDVLRALERYALVSDAPVVSQSERTALYEEALARLRNAGHVYDCACSRADIARAASAPLPGASGDTQTYPGTCREGLPEGKVPRAMRFRIPDDDTVCFEDLIHGPQRESVRECVGDFVVRRADGLFAYQLAVVVDDAEQGVTQVVRGDDLSSSTARQILLQRTLGYTTPAYAHLPLVVDSAGVKLGKRSGALPLPLLDAETVAGTLRVALATLGIEVEASTPATMLDEALRAFDPHAIRRVAFVLPEDFVV